MIHLATSYIIIKHSFEGKGKVKGDSTNSVLKLGTSRVSGSSPPRVRVSNVRQRGKERSDLASLGEFDIKCIIMPSNELANELPTLSGYDTEATIRIPESLEVDFRGGCSLFRQQSWQSPQMGRQHP